MNLSASTYEHWASMFFNFSERYNVLFLFASTPHIWKKNMLQEICGQKLGGEKEKVGVAI